MDRTKEIFDAVLNAMSNKKLLVSPLISNHFKIQDIKKAYHHLSSSKNALGILITYDNKKILKKFYTSKD